MGSFSDSFWANPLYGFLLMTSVMVAGFAFVFMSPATVSPTGGHSTEGFFAAGPSTITVFAHRTSAPYWAPCFATTCSAGTGPGTSMYFILYDSNGTAVQTGFADEYGYTFINLTPGAVYYIYPVDCDSCHGSNHDVVFSQWGDGTSARPKAALPGTSLDAWYVCTNGCA